MAIEKRTLSQLIETAERIGVIGSPSSTGEIALDILGSAVTRKLVGELAAFGYLQDGLPHYALGQITEITLTNVWHEDPTMRSLIRQRGRVDAVSERQDTHQGQMTISAVFAAKEDKYQPSLLGTVPATGTPIYVVSDQVITTLLEPYLKQLFYLGPVYGSRPLLPLWFKHFDAGADGAGEAYHLGVFGKTGSGKSVLAKMMLLAYAKHKKMGLFILDPQGEFSSTLNREGIPTRMGSILCPAILRRMDRPVSSYDLTSIRLDRWELLSELLKEFDFFSEMGIKHVPYQEQTAELLEDFLRNDPQSRLNSLDNGALVRGLQHVSANIQRIYAATAGIDRVREFVSGAVESIVAGEAHPVQDRWEKAIRFFTGRTDSRTPTEIVRVALTQSGGVRPMVVVNLSRKPDDISESVWNDRIKPLLLDRFLDELISSAERVYKNDQSLNTLVVLDEAHRLAPAGTIRNDRLLKIRARLVDAVRTTRKYGLGWMVLSQTLSSLDNEIVQQLRIMFLGFGLGMGSEFEKVRELVGGEQESIRLYQRFRDPQSAFDSDSKEYSFMTIGPVSPLSFSGTPLFYNAFTSIDEFRKANGVELAPKP